MSQVTAAITRLKTNSVLAGGRGRSGGGPALKGPKLAEARTAITKAYAAARSKAGKSAEKLGAPTAWVDNWFKYNLKLDLSAVADGDESASSIIQGLKDTDGQFIYNSWVSQQQRQSIDKVKQDGARMAAAPSEKIKLLKKMGLTGAEFYALCLMVKDQIR